MIGSDGMEGSRTLPYLLVWVAFNILLNKLRIIHLPTTTPPHFRGEEQNTCIMWAFCLGCGLRERCDRTFKVRAVLELDTQSQVWQKLGRQPIFQWFPPATYYKWMKIIMSMNSSMRNRVSLKFLKLKAQAQHEFDRSWQATRN
jgi:hypothetical protein